MLPLFVLLKVQSITNDSIGFGTKVRDHHGLWSGGCFGERKRGWAWLSERTLRETRAVPEDAGSQAMSWWGGKISNCWNYFSSLFAFKHSAHPTHFRIVCSDFLYSFWAVQARFGPVGNAHMNFTCVIDWSFDLDLEPVISGAEMAVNRADLILKVVWKKQTPLHRAAVRWYFLGAESIWSLENWVYQSQNRLKAQQSWNVRAPSEREWGKPQL